MKILIAEDELTSCQIIEDILTALGHCDTVEDGNEAIEAFKKALDENDPYDLVCLDIMMPNVSGQEALKAIREIEKEQNVRSVNRIKAIMVTALDDQKNVVEAFFKGGAASYVVKPIEKSKLLNEIKKLGFIE